MQPWWPLGAMPPAPRGTTSEQVQRLTAGPGPERTTWPKGRPSLLPCLHPSAQPHSCPPGRALSAPRSPCWPEAPGPVHARLSASSTGPLWPVSEPGSWHRLTSAFLGWGGRAQGEEPAPPPDSTRLWPEQGPPLCSAVRVQAHPRHEGDTSNLFPTHLASDPWGPVSSDRRAGARRYLSAA